jgi:hypothetical protein
MRANVSEGLRQLVYVLANDPHLLKELRENPQALLVRYGPTIRNRLRARGSELVQLLGRDVPRPLERVDLRSQPVVVFDGLALEHLAIAALVATVGVVATTATVAVLAISTDS